MNAQHFQPNGWRAKLASLPGGDVLLRHLPAFLLCIVIAPLAAVLAHSLSAPTYVSEARLLLKLGREFRVSGGGGSESIRAVAMYRLNEAINSEVEILSSRELSENVVAEFGVETLYPKIADDEPNAAIALHKAAAEFRESLSIVGIAESSVIRVAFAHHDPALSRDALQMLVDRFRVRHLAVFSDDRLPLAVRGTAEVRTALAAAEEARMKYREDNAIFDPVQERELMLRRRDEARTRLRELETLSERLDHGAGTPGTTGAFDGALQELATLQAEEQRLLQNYYPGSDAVRTVRAQIEALEGRAEAARDTEKLSLRSEVERLEASITAVGKDLLRLDGHDRALRALDRTVRTEEARLLVALGTEQAARADAELNEEEVTSVILIDRPAVPLEPSGAGLSAKVVVSAFAGLMLGASLIALLFLFERQSQSKRELHGAIPAHAG